MPENAILALVTNFKILNMLYCSEHVDITYDHRTISIRVTYYDNMVTFLLSTLFEKMKEHQFDFSCGGLKKWVTKFMDFLL